MESGQGQTIFTAEGALSFHFSCISNSVTYCNYLCPVCRAKWNDLPLAVPNSTTNVDGSLASCPVDRVHESEVPVRSRVMYEPKLILFSDDELPPLVTADPVSSAPPADPPNVSIKAIPERVAVASSESVSEFAVLVEIRAPPLEDNAPHDIVAVLDVSGSMHESKLALLKSCVVFVIDELGPCDRLSIVSFSTRAQRIFPLSRMTEDGRENAKQRVNSLLASGCTNILEALEMGVRILEGRRHKDPVASIMFFSDGMDTCYRGAHYPRPGQPPSYLHLLPASIYPENQRGMGYHDQQEQPFPVHAFCFGADHDHLSMQAISDVSGGYFTLVESYEVVEDDFGMCIGFLLSAVAQELCLMVRSASHGVQIQSLSSERYAISKISNEGSQGLIGFGDFWGEEERNILVNTTVPVCSVGDAENDLNTTSLLDISCSYISVASNNMVQIDCDLVAIRRPISPTPLETTVSLEVDGERNRVLAEQGFIEAQEMAETGDFTGACALLLNRRSTILASASWQAGDGCCRLLEAKMEEMGERMASRELYESDGLSYAHSNIRRHAYQRAIARGSSLPGAVESEGFICGCAAPQGHDRSTSKNMENMVNKSHVLSKKGSSPPK